MKTLKIVCPNCGSAVQPDSIVIEQFRQAIQKDLQKEYSKKEAEYGEKIERLRIEVQEATRQESLLIVREKDKLISDLKEEITKIKNKLNNTSIQLKGEVQEVELEAFLRSHFTEDKVLEVPKGVRGADCSLHVCIGGVEIGTVLFESKRTAMFSNGWIRKLKQDQQRAKSQVAVIVTSVPPKGMTGKFAIMDGVWICLFESEAIRQLTLMLRYSLLKVFEVTRTQKHSNVKAEKLFQYMTSDEYKHIFENILHGFDTLEKSFEDEKRRFALQMKQRQTELENILGNVVEFCANVKSISEEIPEISLRKAS